MAVIMSATDLPEFDATAEYTCKTCKKRMILTSDGHKEYERRERRCVSCFHARLRR